MDTTTAKEKVKEVLLNTAAGELTMMRLEEALGGFTMTEMLAAVNPGGDTIRVILRFQDLGDLPIAAKLTDKANSL